MKILTNIFFIMMCCGNLFAQDLNENYLLFSDLKDHSEYIEFINDSTLIRKPYYSYMRCSLSKLQSANQHKDIFKEYYYEKINDSITIFAFNDNEDIVYRIEANRFLKNTEHKEVYIKRNDFDKFPDLAVYFDNEIFWLDSPKTSNGIIKKKGKKNRKLARAIKKGNTENLNIKMYKGYDAFEKFGYQYVFGILEVSSKKDF